MSSTEAAVLVEVGAPLEIVELQVPELAPGQVLVDVRFSGVCHSQLNEWHGRRGPDPYIPHLLGHEGAGSVRSVGAGVTKVTAGDTVVLSWLKGEGADVPSTKYDSPIGPVNAGAVTTFMRQAVVSENRVFPIPESFDLRVAALLGCAVPTGAGIVYNALALQPGESVAVVGCGGVGLMAIMAAAEIGAGRIVAVDVNQARLEAAEAIGATDLVDAAATDPAAAVLELTGGVDAAAECAGTTATMEQAFSMVRTGGGRAVLAGNPPAGALISIDPFDLIRGRNIAGTWGGGTVIDRDLPRYLEMHAAGRLPVERVLGEEYSLANVNLAMRALESAATTRPMLRM